MSLEKQLADYGRLQEELFGAIEVDEITDPLTEGRQERTPSNQTLFPQRITWRTRYAGPAWAVAAFVAVLAVGAVYLLFSNPGEQVADNPPPTTVAPNVETMTDLKIIEAGVAALYSGDAERAAELFDLPEFDDDEIRREASFQEAIGGRLDMSCMGGIAGLFTCNAYYRNALIDALTTDPEWPTKGGETSRVVVEDGVITEFSFDNHLSIHMTVGGLLEEKGHSVCANSFFITVGEEEPVPVSRPTADCAELILEYLDEWAEQYLANCEIFELAWGTCPPGRPSS